MRRRDRAAELLEADPWDLIVLDEAHHVRRQAAGTPQQKGPNRLLELMQRLKHKSPSLVLLTSTPMQVHPVEIWDLLNLLGLPGKWAESSQSFIRYFDIAGGNPDQAGMEFLATMFRDVEAEFGEVDEDHVGRIMPDLSQLKCKKILKALRDPSGIPIKRLSVAERKGALEVLRRFSPVRYRMCRHTRSLLRAYHQRGLLETPIATRDVVDIPVELSPTEGGCTRQ